MKLVKATLGGLGLRSRLRRSLTSLEGHIQRDDGIDARICKVPSTKLGYPAFGKYTTTGRDKRGIGCVTSQKPPAQLDDVGLDVHGGNLSKILPRRQATNCLSNPLGFRGMKVTPAAILSGNVIRLRQARGWSQTQLASASGLKQTTISAIERAIVDTSIDKLDQLAVAFKLPLWALLLPNLDESLFKGDGLGEVVAIYPALPADGRAEILRVAERERRYHAIPDKPPPDEE